MKRYAITAFIERNDYAIITHAHIIDTAKLQPQGRITHELTLGAFTQLPEDSLEDDTYTYTNKLANGVAYIYESDEDDEKFSHIAHLLGCRRCDECGRWIDRDEIANGDSVWVRGEHKRYCRECNIIRKAKNDIIAMYDPSPRLTDARMTVYGYHDGGLLGFIQCSDENFTWDTFQGVGFELETEGTEGDCEYMIHDGEIRLTSQFNAYNNSVTDPSTGEIKRFFKAETDGSVEYGVEFISAPMTFNYLREEFDYEPIANQMKALGCDDDNPDTGFHIHISKLCFGEDEKTQVENALKVAYYIHRYEDDFFKLCRRANRTNAMSYCKFLDDSTLNRMRYGNSGTEFNHSFRYFPTWHDSSMISSGKTIEFRFFKSTSDAVRIKHTIEIMMGLVEGACKTPWSRIYTNDMLQCVDHKTLRYWRRKGIFVHTKATRDPLTWGEKFDEPVASSSESNANVAEETF